MKRFVLTLAALPLPLLVCPLAAQQQPVNIGTNPNDGMGDSLRVAFGKLNANDADLYARLSTIAQFNSSPVFTTVKIGGPNAQTITGIGMTAGTIAAGNDPRIVGATQNAAAAITGGTISGTAITGGAINGAAIGSTTPAAGTFTTISGDASAVLVQALGTSTPLALKQLVTLGGIHAALFGVKGDGVTDDTAAFQLANTTLKALGGVTDGTPKSWSYPALLVSGNVKLTAPIFPTNVIRGVGRGRIFTTNSANILIDGRRSNDPGNFGFTRFRLENITLQGGKYAIALDNANIDNGILDIVNANISDTSDYAIYVPSAYSTVLNVTDTTFLNCNGDIWTQTDMTNVRGGWSNPIGTNFSPNRAVWNMAHDAKYHQIFNVSDWTGVPNFQTAVAGSHWVDVRGNFSAIRARFGGEFGGIPIAWHYTTANSDAFGNTDTSGYARGGSVSIRDSWAYAGPTTRTDSAAIALQGEAPVSIVFEGNVGPLGVPVVYNASIANPSAYFAAWRTATGKTDEADYFDWRIMDRGARASALVPTGFAHLMRRPARSLLAQATIASNQSLPTGETQILLNTTPFDASGLFSTTSYGFVVPATGIYDLQGAIAGTTTSAAGQYRQAYIRVNGNVALNGVRQYSSAAGQALICVATGKLLLNRGDVVTLYGSSNGGTDTIAAGASATNLTITGPL